MILETLISAILTVVVQQTQLPPPKAKRPPAPPKPIGAFVVAVTPGVSR